MAETAAVWSGRHANATTSRSRWIGYRVWCVSVAPYAAEELDGHGLLCLAGQVLVRARGGEAGDVDALVLGR